MVGQAVDLHADEVLEDEVDQVADAQAAPVDDQVAEELGECPGEEVAVQGVADLYVRALGERFVEGSAFADQHAALAHGDSVGTVLGGADVLGVAVGSAFEAGYPHADVSPGEESHGEEGPRGHGAVVSRELGVEAFLELDVRFGLDFAEDALHVGVVVVDVRQVLLEAVVVVEADVVVVVVELAGEEQLVPRLAHGLRGV